MEPDAPRTPLEAIGVLAVREVEITPTLRHLELYSMRGLLTVLWHGDESLPHAVIAVGGAMGGLLGPGNALYHHLGDELAARGIGMLRVSYRRPNDLEMCITDAAAAVQLAVGHGAQSVVALGHSFGGAVAIGTAIVLDDLVRGVVTFATQSAGCEVATAYGERPLLLFHGDRDEILPPWSSMAVREIAGTGELVMLPGDGHLLDKSHEVMLDRLRTWIPETLGLDA